jgi:hypothetical protein
MKVSAQIGRKFSNEIGNEIFALWKVEVLIQVCHAIFRDGWGETM